MIRFCLLTALVLGTVAVSSFTASAVDKDKEQTVAQVGDPAPEFTLLDDQGKEWKSSEHFGKKIVVLYFYPADFTGGCTKQACGYRDDFSKLQDAGVEIVGISGDSVKNHAAFKKFHNLNFTLLADTKGEAAGKLGVPFTPGEKTVTFEIEGQQESFVRGVTTQRWTIVVGPDGKIAAKRDLKAEGTEAGKDPEVVAELVKKLQAGG
jgi:peroxiredoxin Q/BCP